jgi:carbon-monoxide dehydrogenase large subunit
MTSAFAGRREDDRFVTGQGRYTADWTLPGALHASFRRSDVAHARVVRVDVGAAAQVPGVVRVFCAADFPADAFGTIRPPMTYPGRSGTPIVVPPRPVLARDRVRFVGEELAVVVAESLAIAQEAAALVEIEYDDLPAIVGTEDAIAPGAFALHDLVPDNVCFDFEYGDETQTRRLLSAAAHRVHAVVHTPRVSAAPMEPRSVLAWYDAERRTYEIRCSNQGRETMVTQLAELLRVDRARIRVHLVDVGGAFGPRNAPYPEYAILLEAARRLGRPVRWSSTRTEDMLCDSHGRGIRIEGELALDADGRFLALRTDWLCDQGAYLTAAGPLTNTINGRLIATAGYHMQAMYGRHRLVLTNTNPHNAYRGAGRPEANLIVERLVDTAARRLGLDPLELRLRNALGPDRFPYRTPTGSVLDSGDYRRLLEVAARESDWAGYAARRATSAARGLWRGRGCALFVEPCGGGLLPEDQVALRFSATGHVEAHTATTSNGQGHETIFPELIAGQLGIDPDRVTLRPGDPDGPDLRGNGTIGSRSVLAQGSALTVAAAEAVRKGRAIAASMLEAADDDVRFSDGRYRIVGTDRSVGFLDVVRSGATEAGAGHPLDTLHAQPAPQAFTSGVHVAEVEIDPRTGETTLLSYVAVDDMGTVLNEVLAEGQIVGGVAQAAGEVFGEHCVYEDATGQLLTGSFMDYVMPRADSMPDVRVLSVPTRSPTNALGAKGAGEAGTTGGVATLLSAVCDALGPCGLDDIALPATPFRVWEAIDGATRAGAARNAA